MEQFTRGYHEGNRFRIHRIHLKSSDHVTLIHFEGESHQRFSGWFRRGTWRKMSSPIVSDIVERILQGFRRQYFFQDPRVIEVAAFPAPWSSRTWALPDWGNLEEISWSTSYHPFNFDPKNQIRFAKPNIQAPPLMAGWICWGLVILSHQVGIMSSYVQWHLFFSLGSRKDMKVTSISNTRRNDQDIEFKRYSGIFWTWLFQVTALVADFKQLWSQFCLFTLKGTAFVLLAAQVSLLARTCLSNLPGQQQVPSPRQVQNLDPKKVTSAESAVWHVDQWSPSLAGAACCGCAATRNSVAPALLCRAWAHALPWERRWDPPRPLNRRPCHVDVAGIGDFTVDWGSKNAQPVTGIGAWYNACFKVQSPQKQNMRLNMDPERILSVTNKSGNKPLLKQEVSLSRGM
jgi:hypothetical protein